MNENNINSSVSNFRLANTSVQTEREQKQQLTPREVKNNKTLALMGQVGKINERINLFNNRPSTEANSNLIKVMARPLPMPPKQNSTIPSNNKTIEDFEDPNAQSITPEEAALLTENAIQFHLSASHKTLQPPTLAPNVQKRYIPPPPPKKSNPIQSNQNKVPSFTPSDHKVSTSLVETLSKINKALTLDEKNQLGGDLAIYEKSKKLTESPVDKFYKLNDRVFVKISSNRNSTENKIDVLEKSSNIIGEGASGKVYKSNENRALKVYKDPGSIEGDIDKLKIVNEDGIHTGVLPTPIEVIEFGKNGEVIQIGHVTPECSGNFKDYIEMNIDNNNAQKILNEANQLLQGIKHIHSKGVAHRDLSSENVYFNKNTKGGIDLFIADFGNADTDREIKEQCVKFKIKQDPEEFLIETKKEDIFAIGVILYQRCNGGKKPFDNDNITNLPFNPNVPKEYKDLILNMISNQITNGKFTKRPTSEEALQTLQQIRKMNPPPPPKRTMAPPPKNPNITATQNEASAFSNSDFKVNTSQILPKPLEGTSHDNARKLLQNKPNGTFIFRDSTSVGEHTLSVKIQNKIIHYPISQTNLKNFMNQLIEKEPSKYKVKDTRFDSIKIVENNNLKILVEGRNGGEGNAKEISGEEFVQDLIKHNIISIN